MADLTPERLTEIRQRADGATAGPWKAQDRTLYVVAPGHVHIADFEWLADTQEEWDEFQRNTVFVAAARQDVPALLAEVERLRAELADAREEERRQRETAEAASRGWRNEVAEVDHLRRTVAGWRDSYERLSRQVLRRHHAWQSARRGRKQARGELADLAAQNAKTEDNFRDFAEDALAVQRERDRLAEQAADRDDRIRSLHREVCGGACGLDDACECAYGEAVCDEDRAPYPCPTIRALDGTEAGT